MATYKEVSTVLKEFGIEQTEHGNTPAELLAEALADERENHTNDVSSLQDSVDSKQERIEELEKEIADHVCE